VSFTLDPRLETGSALIADLTLCQARLQDDRRWPWLVLTPRRPGLREIEDLGEADRALLLAEVVAAGRALRSVSPQIAKLNIGALGNIVPQLHVHVVGRWPGDPAWPGPVWGHGQAEPYGPELASIVQALGASLRAG
jgi:diadenosine tetraphosphate (Ap4A) HIT family hydrolase